MDRFTPEQVTALQAPLARDHVKTREQSGQTLFYLEAWVAIAEANRIFGFGNWARETVDLAVVAERPREVGRNRDPGFGVSYRAKVRITVVTADGTIAREGTGCGHGIDRDLGQAHESAMKEAESDAMKRALMTFGNPFGLALYDRTQANVEPAQGRAAAPRTATAAQPPAPPARPTAAPRRPAQPPAPPKQEFHPGTPLPQEEIDLLIATVKDLPPGDAKALNTAFRKHFQVNDGTLTSEFISTSAHRDWITNYVTKLPVPA